MFCFNCAASSNFVSLHFDRSPDKKKSEWPNLVNKADGKHCDAMLDQDFPDILGPVGSARCQGADATYQMNVCGVFADRLHLKCTAF